MTFQKVNEKDLQTIPKNGFKIYLDDRTIYITMDKLLRYLEATFQRCRGHGVHVLVPLKSGPRVHCMQIG